MKIAVRYIYTKIKKNVLQVMTVLSLTFLAFYLIKTIKFILKYNSGFSAVLTLLILNLPQILLFNIIISFFTGIMLAFDNLMKTNEIIACKSIGLSTSEIGKAILRIAIFFSLCLIIMNLVNTVSKKYLTFQEQRIITSSAINALKPNQVNTLGNLELFFKEIKDKKTLKDVYIVQNNIENNKANKKQKDQTEKSITTCDFVNFSSNIKGIHIKGQGCKYLPDRTDKTYFYEAESIEYPVKSLKAKEMPKIEGIFLKLIRKQKLKTFEASIIIDRLSFAYLLLIAVAMALSLPEKTNARCKIKNVNLIPTVYFIYIMLLRSYLHQKMLKQQNLTGIVITICIAIIMLFLIKPLLKISNK